MNVHRENSFFSVTQLKDKTRSSMTLRSIYLLISGDTVCTNCSLTIWKNIMNNANVQTEKRALEFRIRKVASAKTGFQLHDHPDLFSCHHLRWPPFDEPSSFARPTSHPILRLSRRHSGLYTEGLLFVTAIPFFKPRTRAEETTWLIPWNLAWRSLSWMSISL